MAKERFDLRLDGEDIEELEKQANKMKINPSVLARIFIKDGLTQFSPERLKLMDSVDAIQGATTAIREMLLANLFLASRGQVMSLPRNEDETQEAYMARMGSESLRLIKIAMGNVVTIQQQLDGK